MPIAPGTTGSAAGRVEVVNVGAVPVCCRSESPATLDAGKTACSPSKPMSKATGAGLDASICPRICSEIAVTLCVVKRLAVRIRPESTPDQCRASSRCLR